MAITVENAVELGKRSGQARRDRANRLKALESQALAYAQTTVQRVELTVEQPEQEPLDLTRVRQRIDTLDSLMAKATTDREWDNLSRAYERMFKVWMVLSKTPLPGSLRPSSKPDKRLSTQATFDSPLLPADNQLSYSPAPQPKPYDGPENG